MDYDDDVLQQINENVDLLAYAQLSFEFKQQGENYFTSCPLHQDNTPSLSINPEKNQYYCFSCNRGGGIISFLINYENLSFDDAVEKASKLANIDISSVCQSQAILFLKQWKRILYPPNREKEPHTILPQDILKQYDETPAKEWIDEGISREVQRKFGIRIDKYGNRIVYPVYDLNGNLINIKGRTRYKNYKELKLSKYINYYKVGTMDYFQSLEKTLPFVRQQNEIIIFESIKSVMKAYGWGYRNCASAEKHTLTQEQIELLLKLRVNIVFAYDSDVDYWHGEVRENIKKLCRMTNVYIIEDKWNLLGGAETKNSPADCGKEIWEQLYNEKRKVV